MEKYQMDHPFSLCQASAFNFSKQLWAQPDVKKMVLQCIEEDKRWSKYDGTQLQHTLRTEISRRMDESLMPKTVKKDVRFIVEAMGMRLQRWVKEVKKNEKFPVDLALYIDHICWTDYGSVDTSETVRSMYHSKVLPESSATWKELCELCLEDCLIDLWPKVSEIEKSKDQYSHSLMSLYWCYRMQDQLEEQFDHLVMKFYEIMAIYDDEFSFKENIFLYVFACGNYEAVKYFWRSLNHDRRKMTIIVATVNFRIFPDLQPGTAFHEDNDRGLDFVIFWMKNLSIYEQNQLWINKLQYQSVLIQLLKWPCQDFFLEALEIAYEHHGRIDYTTMMLCILDFIDTFHSTDGADWLYHEIFQKAWENLTEKLTGNLDDVFVFITLYSMKDLNWLNYIINDVGPEGLRDTYVYYMKQCFSNWPDSLGSDYFKEFIAKVLVSEEERKQFRIDVARDLKY